MSTFENADTNLDTSSSAAAPQDTVPSFSDANAAPSPAPSSSDVNSAAPSPAPDALPVSSPGDTDPKAGLLAAVKKAIEPKKTETAADTGSGQAKPGEDPLKDIPPDAPLPELTPEEVKSYTPSSQRRIQTLVSERNLARKQLEEVEPFRAYMKDNDLSNDDLAFSLQALSSLKKGDHEGFLKTVFPYVQLAMEYTGRALPPDLQEQVKQGRMVPEVATSMARQRYELGDARQRLERQQEEQAQMHEENARQANRSAVASWEQATRQSDPDYARKLDVAKAYVASIRAEFGDPQTPEDAVAIAKEAYNRASNALKAALPQRAATQMSPSGVQRPSNSGAVAAPKSLMEAAMQGLAAARNRAP